MATTLVNVASSANCVYHTYHATELAGAELIISIHPKHQALLLEPGIPREQRIDLPIDPQVIGRLRTMPEFVRAYGPDGMPPDEFVAFGATQKTLSQFNHVGWALLEAYDATQSIAVTVACL